MGFWSKLFGRDDDEFDGGSVYFGKETEDDTETLTNEEENEEDDEEDDEDVDYHIEYAGIMPEGGICFHVRDYNNGEFCALIVCNRYGETTIIKHPDYIFSKHAIVVLKGMAKACWEANQTTRHTSSESNNL